jgi:cytidylate kinase
MGHVITIDGPAGAGKSTVSRHLAGRLGHLYLDTGAMYRAVALAAKRARIDTSDEEALAGLCRNLDLRFKTDESPPRLFLGNEDISRAIRTPEMDMRASDVSAVSPVREAMTELQRKMAKDADLVAEGRDMGTVVFPDADHKFYLDASPETRAERRYRERVARGERITLARVRAQLERRDGQDRQRRFAPMKPAPGAVIIDTGGLTPEQVIEEIMVHLGRG